MKYSFFAFINFMVAISDICFGEFNKSIPCQYDRSSICFNPGENYPWDGIKKFMEDNQGTMKRMAGDMKDAATFAAETGKVELRSGKSIHQLLRNPCAADTRTEQPYWSTNQKGDLRVIVNQEPFQQFVQMEICRDEEIGVSQCLGSDCTCMQEYRLIRLVAYDPSQDEKGVFMDWFEFPACCQCKCVTSFNETIVVHEKHERDL